MKNLLMISYFAPPYNIPSAVRIGKFAKFLPELGWDPILLTVKDLGFYQKDEEQFSNLNELEIIRTESLDPFRFLNKMKKQDSKNIHRSKENLTNKIKSLFPIDEKIGWMPFCLNAGKKIIKTHKIDAIFCTIGGTNHHAISAYKLAKRFSKPLIVDIRDLWADHPFSKQYFYNKILNNYWERRVLRFATKIVVVTEGQKRFLLEKYDFLRNKIELITNGHDEEDLLDPETIDISNDHLTLTYAGSFYQNITPSDIYNAVKNIKAEKIKIQFIGDFRNNFWRLKKDFEKKKPRSIQVEVISRKNKQALSRYLHRSDILMIFLPNGKEYEGILTTKLFDYLLYKKPILSFCPPKGELASFIKNAELGFISPAGDKNIAENTMKKIIKLYKKNKLSSIHGDESFIQQYSRKKGTKKLSELLEGVI